MTSAAGPGAPAPEAAPGWYADPWRLAEFRWFDGTQWTGAVTAASRPSPLAVVWPARRAQWVTLGIAAAVGLAIWIPAAAMQRRVSLDRAHPSEIAAWYLPAMLLATVVLAALLARNWAYVAAGLVAPQLALALWTTPQGDNDGLWMLIIPMLAVLFGVLFVVSGVAGGLVNSFRRRRTERSLPMRRSA